MKQNDVFFKRSSNVRLPIRSGCIIDLRVCLAQGFDLAERNQVCRADHHVSRPHGMIRLREEAVAQAAGKGVRQAARTDELVVPDVAAATEEEVAQRLRQLAGI